MNKSQKFKCVKCGKEKEKSEGTFIWGGKQFCCKKCCDPKKKPAKDICEFC